jgi:TolB protein
VPGPSGATTPFVSSAWFLASGTPRAARDAGWAFVEWLSQPEQQARIGGTTDFLPANATVTATTPADRWTTEPLLKQTWSVVSGSRPSAEAPSGALQDREIALAMAFWSFFVHDTTVEAALTDTAARITESDTFYDHGPTHYAQCAFGRPPCVDDVELYAVTVDGGNEVPVARALAAESPSWSPDGRRIVYSLNGHLYVMDGDGTHRVQLTSAAALDRHPDWSPDGTRLVFQRGNTPMGGDLYLLDPVTTVATRLTSGDAVDQLPVWSPDGRHIAYASDRAGSSDVWIMDANGEDPRQVTFDHADDWWPTWSPDGRRLAFMSDRDGDVSVYVIDVDGTNEHRLVPEAVSVPAWSPDGRSIAVVDGLTGEVYLVAADGSTRRRLTTSRGGNFAPSWSPDGTRLILGGTRRG